MAKREIKMTARIPVTDEIHNHLKDLTHFTGLTYDELMRYLTLRVGAAVGDRQKNLNWSIEEQEEIAKFKEFLAKEGKGKAQ